MTNFCKQIMFAENRPGPVSFLELNFTARPVRVGPTGHPARVDHWFTAITPRSACTAARAERPVSPARADLCNRI